MARKGIPPERLALMYRYLRDQLVHQFEGNQSKIGRHVGLATSTVHHLLNGRWPDYDTVEKFAQAMGYRDAVHLMHASDPNAPGRQKTLGEAEGFSEAFREAFTTHGDQFPEEVWRAVPTISWSNPPTRATLFLILKAAETVAADRKLSASMRVPVAAKTRGKRPKRIRSGLKSPVRDVDSKK